MLQQRLTKIFAEKEIFFRSEGRVRFLRIGSRLQIGVALILGLCAAAWLVATLAMLYNQAAMANDRAAIDERARAVAVEARKVNAYKRSSSEIVTDLDRRQDALDDMVRSQFGPAADDPAVVGAPDTSTDSANGAAPEKASKKNDKLSAAAPDIATLRAVEQRQTRFARRLAALIDQRSARAEAAIRSFGLNPDQIAVRSSRVSAQGGPYIPWADSTIAADEELTDLAHALARLNALERGLVAIPSGRPTASPMLTSSYGYRRDPFNGHAAFHAGVDFPGAYGQPILAAAAGRIAYVGQRQGYGNVIEIDHGHGIMTRYAHLSRFGVRPGQDVARGFAIARMGSTGRSTGTHLHFEVRVNGAAINPRRFLEVRQDVLQVQQIAKQRVVRAQAVQTDHVG